MPLPPTALAGLRPVPDIDAPPAAPGSNTDAPTPENDADDVRPEWVDYATEDKNCKNCTYMDPGGNCQVLNMPVGPEDHCKAFEAKQGGQQPGQEAPPQASEEEQPQQ